MHTRRSPRNQEILARQLFGPIPKARAKKIRSAPYKKVEIWDIVKRERQPSGGMPADVQLSLGRMFSLMVRPFKEGDAEQYEKCRAVILDHAEGLV